MEKGVFTLPPAPSILPLHRVRPSLLSWPGQGTISSTLSRYTCPFSVYCGATTSLRPELIWNLRSKE